MSIGGFFLAGVWILQSIQLGVKFKDPLHSFKKFANHPIALLAVAFYLLHLVGMIHTEDVAYGLKDLRIKLPLLFLPIVFTGIPAFSRKERSIIEYLFIFASAAAALIIWINYELHFKPTGNVRAAHLFISHIRFGLMVALAAYLIYRHLLFDKSKTRFVLVLPLLILLIYLLRLQSITGSLSLVVVLVISGWVEVARMKHARLKWMLSAFLITMMLGAAGYVGIEAYSYFQIPHHSSEELSQLSAEGNPYEHKTGDTQVENGTLIWSFICWGELADAWRKRSDIPFEGLDKANQPVSSTLIRYVSSKGLKKDREGVNALSDEDIRWIERGVSNYKSPKRRGISRRLQVLFFEINGYLNHANPSGNSLTQRFEFWRAGKYILSDRWLIGVGTGDPPRAFERAYNEIDSPLENHVRHRAHNQYLSLWISLGVIGLIWFLSVLILPFFLCTRSRSLKYIAFITIAILSFFTEDTLETQVGITFFSFFYCYFLILELQKRSVVQDQGEHRIG